MMHALSISFSLSHTHTCTKRKFCIYLGVFLLVKSAGELHHFELYFSGNYGFVNCLKNIKQRNEIPGISSTVDQKISQCSAQYKLFMCQIYFIVGYALPCYTHWQAKTNLFIRHAIVSVCLCMCVCMRGMHGKKVKIIDGTYDDFK